MLLFGSVKDRFIRKFGHDADKAVEELTDAQAEEATELRKAKFKAKTKEFAIGFAKGVLVVGAVVATAVVLYTTFTAVRDGGESSSL